MGKKSSRRFLSKMRHVQKIISEEQYLEDLDRDIEDGTFDNDIVSDLNKVKEKMAEGLLIDSEICLEDKLMEIINEVSGISSEVSDNVSTLKWEADI